MEEYTTFSDGQLIAVIVTCICSSSLSLVGSSAIVFKIIRDRTQNGGMTAYDRFMLGLSTCDIIASIVWAHFPIGSHVWAFGTPATCQAVGFSNQLALSSIWYNSLLSYYFLGLGVRGKNYVQTFEPWLHITAAFWPITAIMGLPLGWYPEDSPCGIIDETISLIVLVIPGLFVYLSVIINYTAIYAIVRRSLRSSEAIVQRSFGLSGQTAGSTFVQKRIRKEATTSMLLYVAAFSVCVVPILVDTILATQTSEYSGRFPVSLLLTILFRLKGFLNFFIYIKPAYTRFRAAYPNKSMRFVLHQALVNSKAPQLYPRRGNDESVPC